MIINKCKQALTIAWAATAVAVPTNPAAGDILTFQQGVNGYDRGQDTSIRWAYGVNFGDTPGYDHSHPGDPGSYELRNTNSGSSEILEVGQFYHHILGGVGGGVFSLEAGPTYRYSRMMIRFRDVFGTAEGQVPSDATIAKATLKLYNTFDLGAEGSAGNAFMGDTVGGPGGVTLDNLHAEPKLNGGKISVYPLLSSIKYGKSDGAAVKGETTAEWKRRGKEMWAATFNKGLWETPNDPIIAQFFGPRDFNDPYIGHQAGPPFDATVTPGVTADYDSSHPGAVEVFQDATEEFKVFDVTGLIDFVTGEGIFLTVLLPDESELPTMEQNFGNAYRSHEFGGTDASADDIATRPLLVIELGDATIPGDANGDGVVDVGDLGIVGANFGSTIATWPDGDFNGDGHVDVSDLGIIGANWSAAQTTGSTTSLIPEPATLTLLGLGVLGLPRRRRQKGHWNGHTRFAGRT